MSHLTLKSSLLTLGILAIPLFAYLFWSSPSQTLSLLDSYKEVGSSVKQDFQSIPTLPLSEEKDSFTLSDNTSDGIDIQFANEDKTLQTNQPKLNLSFPKDYSKPIEVKLDDKRTIEITDLSGKKSYTTDTLQNDQSLGGEASKTSLWQKVLSFGGLASKKEKGPQTYLRYTSSDDRKSLLYAYQKDQASGEKKLKHWTLYQSGSGVEQESYQLKNAKVRVNENGIAEVFYYTEQDLKNDQAAAGVDSNLMERAQRTLAKDMGDDLLSGTHTPDFTIPKPYYLDKGGEKHETEWKWNEETSTLSLSFSPASYPVALDPTLAFTAPGQSNTGSVITGEASSGFGFVMVAGDFNADGKTDLAVGATSYTSTTGRVYIFYNDGAFSATAVAADVVITGEATSDEFGYALAAGDFNADGKTDLAVGADRYNSGFNIGRVYIFYNDGSIPTTAATADVIITGSASDDRFGAALAAGDFNIDGRVDLVIGAYGYNGGGSTGRSYIFYNDGSIPTTAATADIIITGEATSNYFGSTLITGDYNADGNTDLAVGAYGYAAGAATGRAYIFYADGSIPTTAATADVIITGETTSNFFGWSLSSGDYNADGRVDLAVGARGYSSSAGRVYIFNNDGSIPTTAATADVTITGESSSNFGYAMASGDFNVDGRTDLAVGGYSYTSNTGRSYILYNDGSLPTTAATADVMISGEATNSALGRFLVAGDFNADGRTDLAVAASSFASSTGRAYIFYSQNGQVNTNQSIAGNATSDQFGFALTTGDFNADGRTDLAVGATGYNPGAAANTGRVYLFYGDGQIPTTAATADVTITGNAASDQFGGAFGVGDFNYDGKVDLVVGASNYSSQIGRAYIFYNDGSIPTTAATADVTITGSGVGFFGYAFAAADFNADNRIDLVISAYQYPSQVGHVYIFYNDGTIPTTAATADIDISGSGTGFFGASLATGDFNSDGKIDLAVGAWGFTTGEVYIYYNDGSIPTTIGSADLTLTGQTTGDVFGYTVSSGDFNADGRTDLAVGAYASTTNTGRVYIFYNDGSIPTTAATADVIIVGEATNTYFGMALVAGDFNADGRTDLVVGAQYTSSTGRVYVFYNDGTIPTTAATADLILTGVSGDFFGLALATADLNGDGRSDLIVGAYGNTSSTGKVYFYETRENFAWRIQQQFNPSGVSRTGLSSATGQEIKISGEAISNSFGISIASGDLNADGKPDLVVGATGYSSNKGRVYIFYNDGLYPVGAGSADVTISPTAASGLFGDSIVTGDFNADGRVDLAVGNSAISSNAGTIYIFYNDGTYPVTPSGADVTITGEASSNFGSRMAAGDFNADGKTDLVAGAAGYSTSTGRAYIFYNDGSIPTTAVTADVIITGEATTNSFGGYSLAVGDFNADGKVDLAVGAIGYTSNTGRAYIFYNDGSIPATAATADVILTGGAVNDNFSSSLIAGDLNADGRTDLAVGAYGYSTNTGRVYLFYNDGSIPTTAATADVTITDQSSTYQFGYFGSLDVGDFNGDGKTDLVAGSYCYSSCTGRVYIFNNDGSYPTSTSSADVTLTGEAASSYFGIRMTSADFNSDGRIDLAVSSYNFSSSRGQVYLYTLGNDPVITGETTSNQFAASLLTGDFNADGRTDLVVSANTYSTTTGRIYVFYNDGIIPSASSSADAIMTGEATSNAFGSALVAGDFNFDGKVDLAASASGYSSNTGRVYIFYNGSITTENASGADVIISGATNNAFGQALAAGDLNSDGRTDIVVGTSSFFAFVDKAYIFYNDGSIPTTAATADVTMTGDSGSYFGNSLKTGDFNFDGRTDLAVGAYAYSSITGRAYIFNNDGSLPTTAATADVTITGEAASNSFGVAFATGDFNLDGRTDLAIGAKGYSTNTGRAYIFYNDGSIPTTAATADMILSVAVTGTAKQFGTSLEGADYNADGKADLAVSAPGDFTGAGRVYVYYNGSALQSGTGVYDSMIASGESSGTTFGYALASGDLNADGKVDLIVGDYGYSTSTGRVYIIASEVGAPSSPPGVTKMKGTRKIKGTFKIK